MQRKSYRVNPYDLINCSSQSSLHMNTVHINTVALRYHILIIYALVYIVHRISTLVIYIYKYTLYMYVQVYI